MIASLVLGAALLAAQEAAPAATAAIEWRGDLVAALAEAAQRKAPLLAVFRCER